MCRYVLRIANHRADIEPSALFHCCSWIESQQAGREQVAEPMLRHAAEQYRISMGLIADQFGLLSLPAAINRRALFSAASWVAAIARRGPP